MGYDFFITRATGWPEAAHWSEAEGPGIAFEEWQRLVEDDPELEIDYSDRLTEEEMNHLVDTHPELARCRTEYGLFYSPELYRRVKELAKDLKRGETPDITLLSFDTADWTAHPLGEERCFWYGEGCISTKNPDVATIDKMLELAGRLGACVRGDDGEFYRRSERGLDCYTPKRGWLPLEGLR